MKHSLKTYVGANPRDWISLVILTFFFSISFFITSCKKEGKNANMSAASAFGLGYSHPEQIADMNGYLKDFKTRMQSLKSEEMLSLTEAEWHLTNLANFDFGNVVNDYDLVDLSTIETSINVTNGMIGLSDLNATYIQLATSLDAFYQSFNHSDKHFRFIKAEISEDGAITVDMVMTYNTGSKWLWFSNDDFCDYYFDDDTHYIANGNAVGALCYAFNHSVGRNTDPNSSRMYYTLNRTKDFYYNNHIFSTPNYAPNFMNSYLFCTRGYFNEEIPKEDMCFYLDAAIRLAKDYENNDYVVTGNFILHPGVEDTPLQQQTEHFQMKVHYGLPVIASQGNEY